MKKVSLLLSAVTAMAVLAVASAPAAIQVAWTNGDFEIAGVSLDPAGPDAGSALLWDLARNASVGDFDDDGDREAQLAGCGDGTRQFYREISMPASISGGAITFNVDGALTNYSIRAIIISAFDPEALANNALNVVPSPLYNESYWFDDQVLDWNGLRLSGSVTLDPAAADAYNVAGWDTMSSAEKRVFLTTSATLAIVGYGCTEDATALIDDFGWDYF